MPHKLSPSTLNLLKECPKCFWLHFNGKKRPSGIFPSLPSGMDSVLKTHFDTFREKGKLPPELNSLQGQTKLFDNEELLKQWRNNFKGIQWKDENGNILKGAVDNILQKESKLIVMDYKTRGSPLKDDTAAHYQDQLDIYNLLLRKNGYETENYAYLLFYHPSRVLPSGEVVFHTDLIKMEINTENAEKLFKEAIKILEGKMPEAKKECKWCGYAKEPMNK